MKLPRVPHRWALSPRQALDLQRRLAARVTVARPSRPIRLVAGLDGAITFDGTTCAAAAVVWDVRARRVVEVRIAARPVTFPYVPGLLSFRETPALLAALRRLTVRPDALVCDAHGLAHPRRFGLACHVGVLTGLPTIGCAKTVLCGTHMAPGARRGSRARLVHRGETIGVALRTVAGVRPVYVSVGNAIDLFTAVRTILACGAGYRLPEPTRLADRHVRSALR